MPTDDEHRIAPLTHTRTATPYGPDYCFECSDAAQDWVKWPCEASRRNAPSYTLRLERRPWTLNVERQGQTSRWKLAELVRAWRMDFQLLALEARTPPLDAVTVTARPELKNRRSMPDTGACIGAVKAGIDGLVDAGVIPHDGPDVVRRLTFEAPVVTGVDALSLVIEEAAS